MPLDSFIGRADAKIDKGCRIYIPSSFRKVMGEETTFTARLDMTERYLVVYTKEAWDKMVAVVKDNASDYDIDDQELIAQIDSEAITLSIDDQGRFMIPKKLASSLGYSSDVSFVGMTDRFGIWATDRFEEFRANRPPLKEAMEAFYKRHNLNQ